jgi:hypothetical protein
MQHRYARPSTLRRIIIAASILVACAVSAEIHAAERWHGSTITNVYPLSNGGFILNFSVDNAYCSNSNSPRYYYVSVGENGMTAEGLKLLFAASLAAAAGKNTVSFVFDDATSYCYINRLSVVY